jgi:hypothetical protein
MSMAVPISAAGNAGGKELSSFPQTFDDYEDKRVVDTVWELVLISDVVTDMSRIKGDATPN